MHQAHLVDFGETIHVRAEDVRRLPKAFCSQPKMALPCCLADLEVSDEEKALEILRRYAHYFLFEL